jgi:hypothetical protein
VELLLTLVVLIVGGCLLVLPIVALVLAVGAGRRSRGALQRIEHLERQLGLLRRQLEAAPGADAASGADAAPGADAGVEAEAEAAAEADAEAAVEAGAAAEAGAATEAEPAAEAEAAAAAAEAAAAAKPTAAAGAEPVPTAGPAPAPGPAPAAPPQSIEERIGLIWFTRIGAVMGIMAAGWFFKYMVDNDWIGPWGRVALGAVAGVVLLALGQLMARRGRAHPIFVQGLLGLALALLLVTSYASFAFYKLVPVLLAFGVVALLAVLGGALAVLHRSQVILVLALLAAFLNPVLLSTGKDRPLALFAYLLVMTGGALAVAVRLGYRVAVWTSLAGVAALFCGWYARFFDPSGPPPAGLLDRPPAELAGAYHALSSRWVPLLFAALFPAQWVAAGVACARGQRRITGVALVLAAAAGSHAAFAALLFDHPLVLGGVLCGLGVAFAALLVRQQLADWLGVPMVASFAVLASVTGRLEAARLPPMLALTGGLSTIYFVVLLRGAMARGRLGSARTLLLVGGAGLGLAALAALWMLPDHHATLGLLLVGLSGVYLWVATSVGSAVVLGVALLLSAGGMTAAALQCDGTCWGQLAVSAGWFLIYLGFISHDLLVRRSPATSGRLAVLTGAGVGFAALLLLSTGGADHLLRAALTGGAGALYLALGWGLLRRCPQDDRDDRALPPLGLAVVFFTLALAFLFSGPTVTVTWAVEGAVLGYLATGARRRDGGRGHPAWLAAAVAVLVAAVVRMVSLDLLWIDQQRFLFEVSRGARGVLLPGAFAHPRAWSLLAIGLALLVAARFAARRREAPGFGWTAAVMTVAGHGALLGLLVGEARLLWTELPFQVSAGLPADEFSAVMAEVQLAIRGQATKLQMITTLVLGLYGALLLVAGFVARERLHRLLGIALFGLTLAKLGLWDIWNLKTVHKIAVGASIAFLLLVGGYLYGRFSSRIKTLLVEEDP